MQCFLTYRVWICIRYQIFKIYTRKSNIKHQKLPNHLILSFNIYNKTTIFMLFTEVFHKVSFLLFPFYRFRKWFKSTLVLVPLFGVHYALFLSFSFAASSNETLEISWLYVDQTFTSFQVQNMENCTIKNTIRYRTHSHKQVI